MPVTPLIQDILVKEDVIFGGSLSLVTLEKTIYIHITTHIYKDVARFARITFKIE